MSYSNTNDKQAADTPETPKGGTKAAAIALGGTAALAGAAFLASQYFGDDSAGSSNATDAQESNVAQLPDTDDKPPLVPEDATATASPTAEPWNGGADTEQSGPATSGGGPGFDEAFAEARAAHGGGGGHFEWKGDTYNTYTVEEWDDLSVEEKEEFLASIQHGSPAPDTDLAEQSSELPDLDQETSNELQEDTEAISDNDLGDPSVDTSSTDSPTSEAETSDDVQVVGEDLSAVSNQKGADFILESPDDSDVIQLDAPEDVAQDGNELASIEVIDEPDLSQDDTGMADDTFNDAFPTHLDAGDDWVV